MQSNGSSSIKEETNILFEPCSPEEWRTAEALPDATVFQRNDWLGFIADTQGAEIVRLKISGYGRHLGYFAGGLIRKYGMLILGAPFPGWTTAYMGFNIFPEVGIRRIHFLKPLADYAFKHYGVKHMELLDRRISVQDAQESGLLYHTYHGFEIDLAQDEDALFMQMSSACRRCIRKAEKEEVVIEEVHDDTIVDDYYNQLIDVFKKQDLVPTYTRQRVEALYRHMQAGGQTLYLRAIEPGGACIATGIFPAWNDTMYFWGGASYREHQRLRPNEAIMWEAMKYWKQRGVTRFDMGGGGDYKKKYGGAEIATPWFRISRYPALGSLRNAAKTLVKQKQRLMGRMG